MAERESFDIFLGASNTSLRGTVDVNYSTQLSGHSADEGRVGVVGDMDGDGFAEILMSRPALKKVWIVYGSP